MSLMQKTGLDGLVERAKATTQNERKQYLSAAAAAIPGGILGYLTGARLSESYTTVKKVLYTGAGAALTGTLGYLAAGALVKEKKIEPTAACEPEE